MRKSEIIGIFDFDTATVSRNTKKFLKDEEKKKQLENAFHDMPRSFILTKEKNMVEYQKIRQKEGVLSWNTKKWTRRL